MRLPQLRTSLKIVHCPSQQTFTTVTSKVTRSWHWWFLKSDKKKEKKEPRAFKLRDLLFSNGPGKIQTPRVRPQVVLQVVTPTSMLNHNQQRFRGQGLRQRLNFTVKLHTRYASIQTCSGSLRRTSPPSPPSRLHCTLSQYRFPAGFAQDRQWGSGSDTGHKALIIWRRLAMSGRGGGEALCGETESAQTWLQGGEMRSWRRRSSRGRTWERS